MESYKKLNFLLILTIVITVFLVNLYLYGEKLYLLFIEIFVIIAIVLGILIFKKKKHKKIKINFNYDFSFLGCILGIILVIGALFSILGLSKDIFYREQFSLMPFLSLASVAFLLGIALLYFSYMTKKEFSKIKKEIAIKKKKWSNLNIIISILVIIFILSQGALFTFLRKGSFKIIDIVILVSIFIFCLVYIFIKKRKELKIKMLERKDKK